MSLVRVEDICVAVPPISPEATGTAALSQFQSDPALFALPVERAAGIGLLTRAAVMEAMAGPEGRTIFATRPVKWLVADDPMCVAAGTSAGVAARAATEAFPSALSDGFVVTEDGVYRGLVSAAALLRAVAEENAGRARTLSTAAKRLEDAKARISGAARDKAEFLAFLGHEIRTPLTGILGVADLLHDTVPGGEPRRLARTISDSGHHLEQLLNDLLDLSRIEAGKMPLDPAPFDLNEFSAGARDIWAPRLAARKVDFRVRTQADIPRLVGDAVRLRQVLFNLISNAAKFTEQGHVLVEISTTEEAGTHRLRMKVSDTGIGISDVDKARLFEAFEQASAATLHRHGGTGLGLAIARKLAQAMGGSIALDDNPGGGCVFTVDVPVEKAGPRLVAAEPAKTRRPSSGKFELGRVLVVEDHEATAFVIAEALRAAGWKVDQAGTAEEAATRALSTPYQVILSDIHLPGEGGDFILRTLKGSTGPNLMTPVIAMSADLSDARRNACRAAGFTAFLPKPIRPRTLVATLADILMTGGDSESWAQVG
ncbi:MAG: response regulator [Hyphomonas sp.]|nr:response regulator [Hyphomonas sp.]